MRGTDVVCAGRNQICRESSIHGCHDEFRAKSASNRAQLASVISLSEMLVRLRLSSTLVPATVCMCACVRVLCFVEAFAAIRANLSGSQRAIRANTT